MACSSDLDIQLLWLEHSLLGEYKVDVHEAWFGIMNHDENHAVTAFPVALGSWKHAPGCRLVTLDRSASPEPP